MTNQEITWIGASIGDYIVDALIGEGMYSWVYSALGSDNSRRAIKAAKPQEVVAAGTTSTIAFQTQALMNVTGSVVDVQPDTGALLEMQVKKLEAVQTPGMPRVHGSMFNEDMNYYFMDMVPGRTLRQLMKEGPVATDVLIAVAERLRALQSDSKFEHHGDIKPDNIMIDEEEVIILDPGFFGEMRTAGGAMWDMIVTTPSYYPSLHPDDDHALAIMLWEIATGTHPLLGAPQSVNPLRHGDNLIHSIRGAQATGHSRFITPILALQTPSEVNPDVNRQLEEFLLHAIGMQLTADRKLELSNERATVSDTISALQTLRAAGVESFTTQNPL